MLHKQTQIKLILPSGCSDTLYQRAMTYARKPLAYINTRMATKSRKRFEDTQDVRTAYCSIHTQVQDD